MDRAKHPLGLDSTYLNINKYKCQVKVLISNHFKADNF